MLEVQKMKEGKNIFILYLSCTNEILVQTSLFVPARIDNWAIRCVKFPLECFLIHSKDFSKAFWR